jgi:hypothetical protein
MDTALYIKINNRSWAVWCTPQNELLSIPEDEQPFNDKDLYALRQYLYLEGFFSEYFEHMFNLLDEM